MAEDKALPGKSGAPAAPARTSKAFRDRLLAQLPRLAEPVWDSRDAFQLNDVMVAFGTVGADTLLEPLARLARSKGE